MKIRKQISLKSTQLKLQATALKSFRLDKIVADKIRPLKLILESKKKAEILFKNNLFKNENLSIGNDKTSHEKELLSLVRTELQYRLENGESNLTIKFVNNTPTIVPKNV